MLDGRIDSVHEVSEGSWLITLIQELVRFVALRPGEWNPDCIVSLLVTAPTFGFLQSSACHRLPVIGSGLIAKLLDFPFSLGTL